MVERLRQITRKVGLIQLIVVVALPLLSSGVASAHVLKEDNGMSAVLHIDPDDNPEAGQPTVFDFIFAGSGFLLENCNCQVRVTQNQQVIEHATIRQAQLGDTIEGAATLQFPTVGVYDVIVTGAPIGDGNFPAFSLDYLERVASVGGTTSTSSSNANSSDVMIISVASVVLLAMIAYTAIRRGGRYTATKSGKSK